MNRASVVVVGGGISGLATAWELSGAAAGPSELTPRVEVIEASDHFGGSLRSTEFASRTLDLGADGFLARRTEALTLVRELGLDEELEGLHASGAYLFARGSLHELPRELVLGVPTSRGALRHFKAVRWRARLALRRDLVLARRLRLGEDATIGEIVRTKLGRELCYQLVEPVIGGIQAGRVDELSARSVFPALYDAALEGGSLARALARRGAALPGPRSASTAAEVSFYTLRGGVSFLPHALAQRLVDRGVVLRRGAPVSALRPTPGGHYRWEVETENTTTPANAVVLATPAPVTGALLGFLDPAVDQLRNVARAGAAIITLAFGADEIVLPASGTGVLIPLRTPWKGEGSLMITAITFLDRKWPHLAREGDVVLRAHVGRSDDERWREMSDDELVHRACDELASVLARCGAPYETLVQRWSDSLTQYRRGHESLVAAARAASAQAAVALAGAAYDGVGVPACIGSGRLAGRTVLDALG